MAREKKNSGGCGVAAWERLGWEVYRARYDVLDAERKRDGARDEALAAIKRGGLGSAAFADAMRLYTDARCMAAYRGGELRGLKIALAAVAPSPRAETDLTQMQLAEDVVLTGEVSDDASARDEAPEESPDGDDVAGDVAANGGALGDEALDESVVIGSAAAEPDAERVVEAA